jgi:hypothetical protein
MWLNSELESEKKEDSYISINGVKQQRFPGTDVYVMEAHCSWYGYVEQEQAEAMSRDALVDFFRKIKTKKIEMDESDNNE